MPPSGSRPESSARERIDAGLAEVGWAVQDRDEMNLAAGRGVAVREFKLASGHDFADYLLLVNGNEVGVLEAKPEAHTLRGVEVQANKSASGIPAGLDPPVEPLPFLYLSTGATTKFTNLLDPDPNILAQEIAADLRFALGQIEDILGDLDRWAAANDER